MSENTRAYSRYATDVSVRLLSDLLEFSDDPSNYQKTMTGIGRFLGEIIKDDILFDSKCLVVSTAEDADFLSQGVIDGLGSVHQIFAAVFWNNHYQIPGGSVAPIVHKYLQPGFEQADIMIVVKSVISGSCVVRTNILALIERLNVKKIFVVAPVMYEKAEETLKSEFASDISGLFKFVCIATDKIKDQTGEVKPGIGGQIYQRLGIYDQPARTGFVPELVRRHFEGV